MITIPGDGPPAYPIGAELWFELSGEASDSLTACATPPSPRAAPIPTG